MLTTRCLVDAFLHSRLHWCDRVLSVLGPSSSTPFPPSSTLQLTANDHFGVVPCLAAHKVLANTPATYFSFVTFPKLAAIFATPPSDEIPRPTLRLRRGSPSEHRPVPHVCLTSRASSWRLITATSRPLPLLLRGMSTSFDESRKVLPSISTLAMRSTRLALYSTPTSQGRPAFVSMHRPPFSHAFDTSFEVAAPLS